jgi:predicted metal-dependent phosphoesterase TrpH
LIADMAAAGLAGLEADHEDHSAQERAAVRSLAAEHGLVATGSSDFHGANKSIPIGANLTSPEAFAALRASVRAY